MEYICINSPSLSGYQTYSSTMPFWKRTIDITCCLLAMPILGVCTLFVAIITNLVAPGPILFKQERIGYQGKRFKIYKFRTMHVAADTGIHQSYFKDLMQTNVPMTKLDAIGDKRLIPLGWIFRATGLDELPQLLNVLRGEMSLVGPRPCIPSEYEEYLPWQRERVNATPGLTGLWQVSGKNRTTFDEMVRFDIKYARNVALGQDIKIILGTIPALFQQVGDTVKKRKSTSTAASARIGSLPKQTNPASNR